MRDRKGEHNKTGALGELIARKWLQKRGFLISDDNYRKKFGEIDIVAKKGQKVHFVEVKAISYKNRAFLDKSNDFKPEDNVHEHKLQKLRRTIEVWLQENGWEGKFQIDVIAVRMVPSEKLARVKYIDNVI